MNCQSIQDLLIEYITGQTEESIHQAIASHLEQCPNCQEKSSEIESIWKDLGTLNQLEPSPLLRQRFYAMLDKETHPGHSWQKGVYTCIERLFSLKVFPRLAITLSIFFIGLFLGYEFGENRSQQNQILQLGQEVQSIKQQMSMTMLQQASAFDRMEGVRLSEEVHRPHDLLIQMLFAKINTDPSVSVRLAAIDAVALFTSRDDVQNLLINSLLNQESPLVQIALIDQLISLKEKKALSALRILIESQETEREVKTYARRRLHQLT